MLQDHGQIEIMTNPHRLICSKDKTVSATHLFYKSDQSLPRPYLLTSTLKPPPSSHDEPQFSNAYNCPSIISSFWDTTRTVPQ